MIPQNGRTLPISIALSYPFPGDDVSVVIEDAASGIRMLGMKLTAAQFRDLLRAGYVRVDAKAPASFDRVGMEMQRGTKALGYVREEAAREEAEQWKTALGWDSVEIRKTNHGTDLIGRRWVRPDEATETAEATS